MSRNNGGFGIFGKLLRPKMVTFPLFPFLHPSLEIINSTNTRKKE